MWNWLLPDRPSATPSVGLEARRAAAQATGQADTLQQQSPIQQQPQQFRGDAVATVTAIEVQRKKDAELRANDAYWAKRLASQEQAQLKTSGIQEKEFNAAVSIYIYMYINTRIQWIWQNYQYGTPFLQGPLKKH